MKRIAVVATVYRYLSHAQHIERHTLCQLVGDLRGKAILDLACGEGFLTRELKAAPAR